jgi:hypothetical protein
MSYTPHVYIDLDTDGTNGWVDITSDVLARPGARWEYGIRSNRLTDRVAPTGNLDITLDNRTKHYSPNSTDCTTGFGIGNRLKITFEGDTLTSDYEVIWSSEIAYSDATFEDGLYHAIATDRLPAGTLSHNSDTVTSNFVYTGSDLTISVWVKVSSDETWSYTTTAGFSSDALYASVFDFQAAYDTDLLAFNLSAYDSSGTYADKTILATLSFSTDTLTGEATIGSSTDWFHICAVVDVGAGVYLYVNGTQVSNAECAAVATSDATSEALRLFAGDCKSFLGSMGHLAIYNRALSVDEVAGIAGNREFQKDAAFISYGGPPDFYWQLGGTSGVKTTESGLRTSSADVFTKFLGYVAAVRPGADIAGTRVCEVTAQDWMARAARYNIGPVPVQNEVPSGTVVKAVLNYSNIRPQDTEIDTGLNSFVYAADKGEEETAILAELNKIAKSEPGFVYTRHGATSDGDVGEVLVYEDRAQRQQQLSDKMTLADDGSSDAITGLSINRSIGDLYNKVRANIHPVAVDATAVVIYDQDTNVTPEIPPNSTISVFCEYSDSDASFETVGAIDVQVPVRNVDYTISAGSADGPDATADIREAIKGTMSSNLIAYFPLTNVTMNAVLDEVSGGYGYFRLADRYEVASDGLVALSRLTLGSTDTVWYGTGATPPILDAFNGQEGSLVLWARTTTSDIQRGSLSRLFALSFSTNASGVALCEIVVEQLATGADPLYCRYRNSASSNNITDTDYYSTNARMIALTWSYATGGHQLKYYRDGSLISTSSDIFQWPNGEEQRFAVWMAPTSNVSVSNLAMWDTPLAASDISDLWATYIAHGAITMTIERGGVGSTVHFSNPTTARCYVTKLQLKGKRIKRYRDAYAEALDNTSRNLYGQSNLTWDMPYESEPEFARLFAEWLLKKTTTPFTGVDSISFTANASSAIFKQAISLEPGDRIAVQEDQTAINASFHIAGVEYQLKDAENMLVTLYVVSADQAAAWNIGIAGFSEIGTTTFLAL